MPDTPLALRLRAYKTPTERGAVIPALNVTHTNVAGDSAVLTFATSPVVAGTLAQPFYVGVEVRATTGWVPTDDDLFIAYEDLSEDADAGGVVTFTAVSYVPDRLGTHFMGQQDTVDQERTWKGVSAGKILGDLFDQHADLGVERSFSEAADSYGRAWVSKEKGDQTFRQFTSLSAALAALTNGAFCEWHTRGPELVLKRAGTGTDRSAGNTPVRLGIGAKSVKVRTSIEETATDFIVVSDQKDVAPQRVQRPALGAGTRQAIVTVAGAKTPEAALRQAEPLIEAASTVKREVTVIYDAGALKHRPYQHFRIGDMLKVKSRGSWESRRLIGVQISTTQSATEVRLTFDDRFLTLQAKLAGRTASLALGTVGGTGGNGGSIPSNPTPTNGEPKAPAAVGVVQNVASFQPDGRATAIIKLDWPSITQTVDGVNTLVTQYDLWVRRDDGPSVSTMTLEDSEAEIELQSGAVRYAKVRAYNGRWSAFSPEVAVVAAMPQQQLEPPTKPTMKGELGIATVSWDGKLGTAKLSPGVGFRRVVAEYRIGTTGAFVAMAGFSTSAGQVAAVQVKVGDVVQARLVAEDTLARRTDPSEIAEVKVTGIRPGDLTEDLSTTIDKAIQDAANAKAGVGDAISRSLDQYTVTNSATTKPGSSAVWSADTPDWKPGQYVWRRTQNTRINGDVTYSAPAVITGADGTPGADAVLLRVASSRGVTFKNSGVSTVLTATVSKGTKQITSLADLWATFGSTAYLEWQWRRPADTAFVTISSSDSRISQGGFALTVSPSDVDQQAVFQCLLQTD